MSFGLQIGTIFAGRYRILRCIASGGMGAVYEVLHRETERRRALKVMLPHMLRDEALRERFMQEAKVAAQVESKFIVDVFDAGVDEATDMPFLVMELLQGEEIGRRIKRAGRFSPTEALLYLQQTALALDKTHRASIVHRDLKPENLFLVQRDDEMPHIKVLDFGVAKIVAEGKHSAGVTMTVGTPLYMAPEQYHKGPITPAADIFSLGMISFTLLVGKAYWAEDLLGDRDPIVFALTAVLGPKEPACSRAARHGVTLPPEFDVWFTKVTALEPRDRFPTATAAIAALAEVYGGPLSNRGLFSSYGDIPPPSGSSNAVGSGLLNASVTRSPMRPRRESILWVTLAIIATGIGGGAAIVLVRPRAGPPPAPAALVATALPARPTAASSASAPAAQAPAPREPASAAAEPLPRASAAAGASPTAKALASAAPSGPKPAQDLRLVPLYSPD